MALLSRIRSSASLKCRFKNPTLPQFFPWSANCDLVLNSKLMTFNMEFSQKLEKNLEALEMEVQDLNAMRNDLLKRVTKEEGRGLQMLPEVREWISKVEEIELKASRLLDQSISELQKLSKYNAIMHISTATHHYSEYSGTVCRTLKEVETHKSKGVFKELVERAPLSHGKKRASLQKIASRELLLEKVWKCLMENECRTLGFYGMNGVGKTTLLTQVKNKFIEVGDVASLVIFVVVKSEDVEGIQDEIGERLGLYGRQGTKEERASAISKFLSRKRFVLFLEGMQRKVDLEEIGIPLPSRENGCKIVFTTRSQEACGSMWVDAVEEVECLSTEESLVLFQKIVGETTLKSHPDIPQLARIVARKSGGLPITLNLIGKIMSHKKTVREWHQAIHVLVSSTDREVPILKFTYDNLPDENIKSCFLYCALFPENCDISKRDLVDCWIGEGIVEEEEDRETAENKGYEIIGDLVRVGLLMENKSGYGVKMHGMVLEMALWVTSDFSRSEENFVVKCGERIYKMPTVSDWNTVRRMSVSSTQIEIVSGSSPCSKLTTLFLQDNKNLKKISGDFFQWMTSLVVLNLSRNTELSELPEDVSSLVSLQFLNLSGTWIDRLPLGLKELERLIHLDLDHTSNLKEFEVIASLLNLQVLRLFHSAPMDLRLMESLQLLKSLKELSLTVVEDSVFERLLSSHGLASCIRRLRLENIAITNGVISLLNAMFSLRELDIFGCNIPETTIDWRSTIQMKKVHSGNVEMIPQFRNMRTVSLHGCSGLRDLTWLLVAPNLDELMLSRCPQIEEVISKEKTMSQRGHTSEQPFQNLTRLSLNDLARLESIYWTSLPFPVLEYIQISDCPKLRRLPFNSETAKQNQVELEIDEDCLKGVECEDEPIQHFSDFSNRDFPQIAEEQNMASESHPIKNIVLVGTSDSGESATTSSISGKKVLGTHAANEIIRSEVVTELVKQLNVLSSTSNKCSGIAGDLATMVDGVQPVIKQMLYSGIELRMHPHHQHLLRFFFETLEKGRKLTEKVLRCRHWDVVQQLMYHKKMEDIGKRVSSLIRGPLFTHILADIHYHRVNSEANFSLSEKILSMKIRGHGMNRDAMNAADATIEMVTDGNLENLGVGLELGKKKVKEMMFISKDEASLIGISGMIGSGKTTLAKEIERDEEVRGYFENQVLFLTVSRSPDIKELRSLIWGFLIGYDGSGATIPAICIETRKLVILDDVCTRESLDQLMYKIPGITTLVVSRSKFADAKTTYDVELLDGDEATSLFCLFAFGQKSVPSGFSEDLVNQVVEECEGLPLSLKVVGASLKDRPEKYWEGAAKRLSRGEPADETYESSVFAHMEAALETLDLTARECFLDMGAFPKDMKIPLDVLINMWVEMYDLEDVIAFAVLVDLSDKNLLTLVKDPRFGAMYTSYHDLFVTQHGVLRDLALYLSNRERVNRRERLLMPKREVVLPREWERRNNEPYNARVVSIHTEEMNEMDWFDMELPKAEVLILNFTSDKYALPPFIAKMGRLRVLVIINNGVSPAYLQDFIYPTSAKLRSLWLERVHVPALSSCTVTLKNLHKMSLILCKINNSFKQTALEMAQMFPNLSDLTIDHCDDLVELSSTIFDITSLKSITITNCPCINGLPQNLSKLKALELLRLYACLELKSLPVEICELPSLKYLDISQCVSLTTLPEEMGNLKKLEKIDMRECGILSIPSSAVSLTTLCHVICDEEDLWMWEEVKKAVPGLRVEAAEEMP